MYKNAGFLLGYDLTKKMRSVSEDVALTLLNSTGDPVLLIDESGRVLAANRAAIERSGHREAVSLLSTYDLFPPTVAQQLAMSCQRARLERKMCRFEAEWSSKWYSYSVYPVFEGEGGNARFAVYVQDITERKELEAELVQARNEYALAFDAVPDLIAVVDSEYRIVRANKTLLKRLGIPSEELIGKYCYTVIHGTDSPPPFCPHAALLSDGKAHRTEIYEPRLDGYFLVSVSPLHDLDGNIIGSVHVARDITDRKLAEEELRKAHDELGQRVIERTRELAEANERLRLLSRELLEVQEKERKRVAQDLHDGIGQILTAIKFKLESMLENKAKKSPGGANRSLQDLLPMIQQGIEEVRRIQMDLRPSLLDDLGILATLNWFCREFGKVYPHIHIEKELSVQEQEVPVSLKTVIYRVVQEAFNNAAKHSEADRVRLSLKIVDGTLELEIRDNGRGFNPAEVASIPSAERGFGLSGMMERVELSGGSFEIESKPGSGTSIRSKWPIDHSENQPFIGHLP